MVSDMTHVYGELYVASCFLLGAHPAAYHHPLSRYDATEAGRYSYPWKGGYSTVNFFRSLGGSLPLRYRSEVLEISYASPGFIELIGFLGAFNLSVRLLVSSASRVADLLHKIDKQLRERKLNKLELRQRTAHTAYVESLYGQLVEAMDLPKDADARLRAVTNQDSWARLKILMAIARRLERISNYRCAGILELGEPRSVRDTLHDGVSQGKHRKIAQKVQTQAPPTEVQESLPRRSVSEDQ